MTERLKCLECVELMASHGYGTTLVGVDRDSCPLGKVHDDNCRAYRMRCPNHHERMVQQRQVCECGWKGKLTCFCHEGEKLEFDPSPTMEGQP